jgi:hypothetical protein
VYTIPVYSKEEMELMFQQELARELGVPIAELT